MEVKVDLTTSFKEAIIPDVFEFSETDDKPLKRRILAVSAGTHNGLVFTEEEINKMVEESVKLKEAEERTYFAAPLVLDHSYRFVDKVGSTFNLFFDEELKAAIADVEFWQFTGMLKEVAERVKHDPENTYFSVRIAGDLKEDNTLTDLRLIHIAPVLEPADKNARIVGELSNQGEQEGDQGNSSDFALNNDEETGFSMEADLQEKITDLEKQVEVKDNEIKDLQDKLSKADTNLKEAEDKVVLMAEILSADTEVDRDFLKSLSKEQLEKYKADLDRRAPIDSSEKSKTGGGIENPHELAEKYFGGVS